MKSVPVTGMGWIPLIAATAGLLAGGAGPAWSQQQCPASAAACQFDVSADYFALLGRTPDWGGWTFWYYQIYTAGLPRDTMTSDLLASQEYYNSCGTKLDNKTYYTIGLDTTKNPAVPGGLAAGTYGQQGGPPSWCGNQTYSAQWAPSNSDFLTLFYWDAVNRAPDEDGWGFWYCGLVPSATPCNSSNQPITQAQTVDNFLTSTEFANDWGVSNVVTPGPATVNPTSLSNGGWQTVTVAYTSCLGQTCGVSGVGSGTVFVGTGNPTVYGSTLTGCEIEWTAGQSVALYELYNGTSTESSGTMPGSGVLGGAAVCALDTAHSSYNPNTGTLSLSLSYLSTMSGQQTVYSYGADAQGWPTLPGISLATFTIGSAPTITSVSSLSTAVGGQITIYGTNFVAEPTVYFGNVQASVVSWTSGASGSVTAGVPCTLAPGSPYPISITVAGLSSGPYSQSFTPPVAIGKHAKPGSARLGSDDIRVELRRLRGFGDFWGGAGNGHIVGWQPDRGRCSDHSHGGCRIPRVRDCKWRPGRLAGIFLPSGAATGAEHNKPIADLGARPDGRRDHRTELRCGRHGGVGRSEHAGGRVELDADYGWSSGWHAVEHAIERDGYGERVAQPEQPDFHGGGPVRVPVADSYSRRTRLCS